MSFDRVLSRDERATFTLRKLYAEYGYTRYKMNKFEEYDLYVRNKDFLSSDSIITFTDTDGKLLALKPDVTLSIIKNNKVSRGVTKLFYNENVYRVSKGTGAFREILQTGLECIGEIGVAEVREVLTLAAKSLEAISDRYVLEISSLDVVRAVLTHFGISEAGKKAINELLGKKNADGIKAICRDEGVSESDAESIVLLATVYGDAESVIERLGALRLDDACGKAIDELAEAVSGLGAETSIDFSVTGGSNYYNGVSFLGYIEGAPTSILKGGRYDALAERVSGKRSGAIGFAVYLDELERLGEDA